MTMFLLPNNIFLPLEASDSMARQMKANPNFMKNLLKRHIIMSQKLMPADIENEMLVPAMSGDVLRFNTCDKVSHIKLNIVRVQSATLKFSVTFYFKILGNIIITLGFIE